MKVEKNTKVTLDYEGKLKDGSIFDSSKQHGNPLSFVAGVGMVVPGFDKAVLGMSEGEEKEFTITPEEGYGPYRDDLKKEVPKDIIPKDKPVEVGMMIALGTPDGRQFPAKIVDINDANIIVDLNHPLAGKELTFKIKVIKTEELSEEEKKCMTDPNKACCGSDDCECEEESSNESSSSECGCCASPSEKEETNPKKDESVEDLV